MKEAFIVATKKKDKVTSSVMSVVITIIIVFGVIFGLTILFFLCKICVSLSTYYDEPSKPTQIIVITADALPTDIDALESIANLERHASVLSVLSQTQRGRSFSIVGTPTFERTRRYSGSSIGSQSMIHNQSMTSLDSFVSNLSRPPYTERTNYPVGPPPPYNPNDPYSRSSQVYPLQEEESEHEQGHLLSENDTSSSNTLHNSEQSDPSLQELTTRNCSNDIGTIV